MKYEKINNKRTITQVQIKQKTLLILFASCQLDDYYYDFEMLFTMSIKSVF